MLVRTAFNMVKENQLVGWVSVASAVVIYLITKALDPGNALVYTIVGLAHHFQRGGQAGRAETWGEHCGGKDVPSEAGKPVVNLSVIRGALSLACLTIGANIAFGNITSGMGAGELNVDHLTVYSGPGGRRELAVWRRPGGGHHLSHGRRAARGAVGASI